jgi:hypothetical protein
MALLGNLFQNRILRIIPASLDGSFSRPTSGVLSFLFEPGRTQNISIGNLAPGHYKFYVVRQERGIAFKSSENTPTSLGPGQDVWLHPGEKEEISVVEPDLE